MYLDGHRRHMPHLLTALLGIEGQRRDRVERDRGNESGMALRVRCDPERRAADGLHRIRPKMQIVQDRANFGRNFRKALALLQNKEASRLQRTRGRLRGLALRIFDRLHPQIQILDETVTQRPSIVRARHCVSKTDFGPFLNRFALLGQCLRKLQIAQRRKSGGWISWRKG